MESAKRPFTALVLAALLGLAACAQTSGIHDPHEERNRAVFEANAEIDRAVFSRLAQDAPDAPAQGGGGMTVAEVVSNAGSNLRVPSAVANSLLQGRLDAALENTVRFAINTTIGLGGVFDPATALGVTGRNTDFGETLYVWGVGEGAYVVLPLLGPSTERDAVGFVVDRLINPLDFVLDGNERMAARALTIGARVGDRVRYADLLDLVTESADPYAQARLFYLQNRRFRLGGDDEEEYIDPYEDF